jgi:thiamine biosynthesis lipoprotein ApbE
MSSHVHPPRDAAAAPLGTVSGWRLGQNARRVLLTMRERLMSLYDAHSAIARPDPWTGAVVALSKRVAASTSGSVDVTVQPLWRLFRAHADRGTLPTAAAVADSPSTFTADRHHHPVFDPPRGWSPAAFSAVSVIAATATAADAWSTAIMVGGAALAQRALTRGEVQGVWMVDKQGHGRWAS